MSITAEVEASIKKLGAALIRNANDNAKAYLAAGLPPSIWDQPVLWWVKNNAEAKALRNQLSFWIKDIDISLYPLISPEEQELDNETVWTQIVKRQQSLSQILLGTTRKIIILTPENLVGSLPSPALINNKIWDASPGLTISPDDVIRRLPAAHFREEDKVFYPGYFSRRGGIIDLWPVNLNKPIRIEFAGDTIDQVRQFNPADGTTKILKTAPQIFPCFIKDTGATFAEYLKMNNGILNISDDLARLTEEIDLGLSDKVSEALGDSKRLVWLSPLVKPRDNEIDANVSSLDLPRGNLPNLQRIVSKKIKEGYQIQFLTNKKDALEKVLGQGNLAGITYNQEDPLDFPFVLGWDDHDRKKLFITDHEIWLERKAINQGELDKAFINGLAPGQLVVHLDHGIGKYMGMARKEIDEGLREFFIIEYAEGDRLFLPAEYADKISKYIGAPHPTIHRLHGITWQETKNKIKENSRRTARELLKIYALRDMSTGTPFTKTTKNFKELQDSFPYQETPDQERTLKEVMADLAKTSNNIRAETGATKPMDRLICGDVGFGKTEIAIRAAFKVTESGKQVALLAPTTILAQQHFDTFVKRLANFPVRVGILSRFKSDKEQQETIKKLKEGNIDIVIGTHRLLSRDVKFKDLGLFIIDEEQKFGVGQKDKLKQLRAAVDILSLSATPIPRTLNLALAGLRDISTITTPPSGRREIRTIIEPGSDNLIKKAVERELGRSGQAYLLYNEVETIDAYTKKIAKLIPNAKIGIAHGQLPERELAKVMEDFDHGKVNLLVCSSIIENGLDLPNVNTLIVNRATNFGLADLYQIRGRIGRSDKQGYAYFLYHSKKLKPTARKRLEALLEAKELGSGFKLAMRDLEIRGAGNILGKEQSGNVIAIGLNLYLNLLHQTTEELQTGKPQEDEIDATIDLPINAYIPDDFIPDTKKRSMIYQEIADLSSIKKLMDYRSNLKKKSRDPLPGEVINIFKVLELKILARRAKIISIDTAIIHRQDGSRERRLVLKFLGKTNYKAAHKLIKKNPRWDVGEDRVRIELEKLGKNWLDKLIGEIKILK